MSDIATTFYVIFQHVIKENKMKKLVALIALFLLLGGSVWSVMAGSGPAPNSGDGVSDGSGMDTQNGPNSDAGDSPGPAPNSGDGVSDGSGMN